MSQVSVFVHCKKWSLYLVVMNSRQWAVNLVGLPVISPNFTNNFQRRSPSTGRMATGAHIPQKPVRHILKACILWRLEQSRTLLRRRPWKHWSFRTGEASHVRKGEPGRVRCWEKDWSYSTLQLQLVVRGSAEHVPWLPVRWQTFGLRTPMDDENPSCSC